MKTYLAISSDGECFLRKIIKQRHRSLGIKFYVLSAELVLKINQILEKDFMETEEINTPKHRHIQKFQEIDDEVIISFKKAHDEQKHDEEIYDSILLMTNSRKRFYWSKSSGLTFR